MPFTFRLFRMFDVITRHLSKRGGWWLLGLVTFTTVLWAWYSLEAEAVSGHENKAPPTLAVALWHGLFASLQFLVLNKELPQVLSFSSIDLSGGLTIGLFLMQLVLPTIAAFSAISALYREQFLGWLLRRGISRIKGHHVVFGFGKIGQAIVKASQKQNRNVTAVDREGHDRLEDLFLDEAHNDGGCGKNRALLPVILAANAAVKGGEQKNLFQHLGCISANQIFLALPDEQANFQLLKGLGQSPSKAVIHVRTKSEASFRLFLDWLSLDICKNLDVRPFNPYQIAARGIVNRYPPDLYVTTDRKDKISQTIMITGVSELAIALVLRFARVGIYSPEGKLKIVWAGKGTAQAYADLPQQYPALARKPDPRRWLAADTGDASYLEELLPPCEIEVFEFTPAEHFIRTKTLPSAIYVCEEDDIAGAVIARDLQAALGECDMTREPKQRLILLATSGRSPQLRTKSGELIDSDRDVIERARYAIEQLDIDDFFADTLLGDKADVIAKRYQAAYDKKPVDDNDWKVLSFFEKESNRDAADHLAIKARYAGLDPESVADVVFGGKEDPIVGAAEKFKNCAADLVAMEQRRYRAFMFMMGFRHGSIGDEAMKMKNKKAMKSLDRILRVNGTLLTKNLPDHETAKDDDIINKSLEVLQTPQ